MADDAGYQLCHCSRINDDGSTFRYVPPTPWPRRTILTYHFDPTGMPGDLTVDEVDSAIDAAVAVWQGNQTLSSWPLTFQRSSGVGKQDVVIRFEPLPQGTYAESTIPSGLHLNDQLSITLNRTEQFTTSGAAGQFDLESVLLHEWGHILGLGDIFPPQHDVMDGSLGRGEARHELTATDDDEINRLYRPAGGIPGASGSLGAAGTGPDPEWAAQYNFYRTYDDFAGALRLGDVLVVSQSGPLANMIKWLDDAPVDHVAIFVSDLPTELEGVTGLPLEDVRSVPWVVQAGALFSTPGDHTVRPPHSTIEYTPLRVLAGLNPDPQHLPIGVTGPPTRVFVLRYNGAIDSGKVQDGALERYHQCALFDYDHLKTLAGIWLNRSIKAIPNDPNDDAKNFATVIWGEIEDTIDGMAKRIIARRKDAVTDWPLTTCARFVYEVFTQDGAPVDIGTDRRPNPEEPDENVADWITPYDLLLSGSFDRVGEFGLI